MFIKTISPKLILFLIISFFAFFINNYYGNLGLFPLDSLGFLDSGYSILKNKHPFKDYWIISGPVLDYIQAIFFKLFGLNWSSFIYHASFFNALVSSVFFFTLIHHNLNIYLSFIFAISVAILCYPVAGTPFAYQHSFILSLISIFIFTIAIKSNSSLIWFFLPIVMVLSFLCQQSPSALINFILIAFITIHFILDWNKKKIIFFVSGSLTALFFLFLFFILTKIPLINFIEQYLLFPLTIGKNRIVGSELAYESANLFNKFTYRGVVGHFKFINLFILGLAILTIMQFSKKFRKFLLLENIFCNLVLIFSSVAFIFHQLITANQTFIFSLIPILGGFFYLEINNYFRKKKIINFLIIIIIIFTTIKYHNVYNVNRKFMDLQHADLSKHVDASLIHKKLNGLKWITPNYKDNPLKEIGLIKDTLQIIKKDKRNKMVITHYQFFSFLLEEDLNLLNRWYFPGDNTFPSANHKHFEIYKKHFNKSLKKNDIDVIYIVNSMPPGEINIDMFSPYFDNICFESKLENSITFSYILKKCQI